MSRGFWRVWQRRRDGAARQVKPSWWRRPGKVARYAAAKRVRDQRPGRFMRAASWRPTLQPAWKTHLTGDTSIPAGVSSSTKRNARRLRGKTGRAFKRAGVIGHVNSFVRTYAEQQAQYDALGPGRAALPGTSFHELGLAIDVSDTDGRTADGEHAIEKHLRAEGLHTPLEGEDWHITETDRWG